MHRVALVTMCLSMRRPLEIQDWKHKHKTTHTNMSQIPTFHSSGVRGDAKKATLGMTPEEMCTASICALMAQLNASHQSGSGTIDILSFVDEDTPASVLQLYSAYNISVLPGFDSDFTAPPFYKANDATSRYHAPGNSTHHKLINDGAPYGWVKFKLWNMTKYDAVLFFDPDVFFRRSPHLLLKLSMVSQWIS